MNNFTYAYPMKVYFGEDAAKNAIAAELGRFGKTVMLTDAKSQEGEDIQLLPIGKKYLLYRDSEVKYPV